MKISDYTPKVQSDISQRGSLFLRFMTDEVLKISTPVTPKDKGNLRRDVLKQVLGLSGKIAWQKNYAAFQEDRQYRNYTTPGTGPHFAEDSVKKAINNTEVIAKRAWR